MTFKPQHSFFATNDFIETGGAIYSNPSQFKIINGVTKFLPNNYTGNTFTYNGGPWAQPNVWCIDSSVDTWEELSTNFGVYTGATGHVYFEGQFANQAVITKVPSAYTGNTQWMPGEYIYPTGGSPLDQPGACFSIGYVDALDWPCPGVFANWQHTYEFDVRVLSSDYPTLERVWSSFKCFFGTKNLNKK